MIDAISEVARSLDQHQLTIGEYDKWRESTRPTSKLISARLGG